MRIIRLLFFVVGLFLVSISLLAQKKVPKKTSKKYDEIFPVSFLFNDSSKVSPKKMDQFNKFQKNEYPFPAKPRSMGEISLGLGYAMIDGDVPSDWRGLGGTLAGGLSISYRKAISPIISFRGSYTGIYTYGLDWKDKTGKAGGNSTWDKIYTGEKYYANYRNIMHALSADAIFSLNTRSFFRGNPWINLYAFGGYTALASDLNIAAFDSKGKKWDFSKIVFVQNGAPRTINNIKQDLRSGLRDASYSTRVRNSTSIPSTELISTAILSKKNWILRHAIDIGVGAAIKINSRINVGFEEKLIDAFSDNLDGIADGNRDDIVSFTSLKFNYSIGNKNKNVEPLWWINPLNYIYSELNEPKHTKIPVPKLLDSDGDGVIDQFDLEPNTPNGASVDTHGRMLDSDGDGIPDFKDKEKLTLKEAFPVNALGEGNYPIPACCSKLEDLEKSLDSLKNNTTKVYCELDNLPTISFLGNSKILTDKSKDLLDSLGYRLQLNKDCKIRMIGHSLANKISKQRTNERFQVIIHYLNDKKGIAENRFVSTILEGSEQLNNVVLIKQ